MKKSIILNNSQTGTYLASRPFSANENLELFRGQWYAIEEIKVLFSTLIIRTKYYRMGYIQVF